MYNTDQDQHGFQHDEQNNPFIIKTIWRVTCFICKVVSSDCAACSFYTVQLLHLRSKNKMKLLKNCDTHTTKEPSIRNKNVISDLAL